MKKQHIIILIVIILGLGTYLFRSQPESTELVQQKTTEEVAILPDISDLSEEELTALWANGERCPEKLFSPIEELGQPILGLLLIVFENNTICEEVEQMVHSVNGKIIQLESHSSVFEVPAQTFDEQDEIELFLRTRYNSQIKYIDNIYNPDYREF